jgi:adenosylmethionine-8-amino-7-oxononanoate aminotransferase
MVSHEEMGRALRDEWQTHPEMTDEQSREFLKRAFSVDDSTAMTLVALNRTLARRGDTVTHTARGTTYEIRTVRAENGIVVRTFRDNRQVSPTYRLSYDDLHNFDNYGYQFLGKHALETLIDLAKSHIDEGWVK